MILDQLHNIYSDLVKSMRMIFDLVRYLHCCQSKAMLYTERDSFPTGFETDRVMNKRQLGVNSSIQYNNVQPLALVRIISSSF